MLLPEQGGSTPCAYNFLIGLHQGKYSEAFERLTGKPSVGELLPVCRRLANCVGLALGTSCRSVLFFGQLPIEKDVDRLGRGIFELGHDEETAVTRNVVLLLAGSKKAVRSE